MSVALMTGPADRGTGARRAAPQQAGESDAARGRGRFLPEPLQEHFFCRAAYQPCANCVGRLYSTRLLALHLRSASRLVAGVGAVARLYQAAACCEVQIRSTGGGIADCMRGRT